VRKLAHSLASDNLHPAGLAAGGANSTLMANETRVERRLDRLIDRAQNPRSAAMVIAGVSTVMTVGAGLLMTLVDHENFPSLGKGLWWSVQTVTTVGYGDHVPQNAGGQIVAAIVMLVGIGFITVITASITGAFVERSRKDHETSGNEASAEQLRQIDERLARIEAALRERP
jgi:voltage-gated potassium channel